MKRNLTKVILVCMVVFVLGISFMGCSNDNDVNNDVNNGEQQANVENSNDNIEPDEDVNGVKESEEDVNGVKESEEENELDEYAIEIALPGAEQKDMGLIQEKINEITKEKINATINITTIGFSSWAQQTNLMFASGEKLDLVWTASFFNYNANVAKGQLLPLDELINDYGNEVVNVLGEDVLNGARVNGSIYGLPSVRDFAADYGFIMRKDMVDKYSIDTQSISQASDMTTVFEVINENETDVLPFVTTQTMTIAELLGQGSYDKLNDWMGVVGVDDDSLEVINFFESDFYKETLDLVRDWYKNGYLSKDASTSQETPDSMVKAGKAFSYAYAGKPGIAAQESRKTGMEMIYVPITSPVATTSIITGGMMSIPHNSQDPQRAMMLMNLWYGDENIVNLFDNGIEGTHYVMNESGQLAYPEGTDSSNATYTPINYRIGNNFLAKTWSSDSLDIWETMDNFNKSAIKSVALGFSFDSESVKTEVAAVSNVISQFRMGLDTGTLDPDVSLPEYLSELKDAGLDKIIEEKQAQIDDWLNK